ncbi:MAG TPA: DUF5050 domain-containing protein [Pseudobacteroides sp.]|uniref:DUF5050 domain-containing protein n=1 Tax=Pseudobacteroides sp. TaxID=1968840 RepID=UPI002F9348E1
MGKVLVICVLIIIFLIGCKNKMNQKKLNGTQDGNSIGNTSGNIANSGSVALKNGWLYYFNFIDKGKLYKKDINDNKFKLSDEMCANINVKDDWVIYTSLEDGTIYKVKNDGTVKECYTEKGEYLNVTNDWIYYSNKMDGGKLYKIKIDNKKRLKLNNQESAYLNVIDNSIFYIAEGYKLHKISIDGSNKYDYDSEIRCDYLNVVGEWLYFSDPTNNYKICKMKKDGSDFQELNSNEGCHFLNVSDNWIYYCNDSDGSKLYKVSINGTNNTKICDDRAELINIIDNWVYYSNDSEGSKFYRIKQDGSGREIVD